MTAWRNLLAAMAVAIGPGIAMAQPALKLGVLTDLSGQYSDITGTGSVLATRMAVEDCLVAECRGMTIDVVFADHGNKPDTALTIAHNWFDNEHVDAIVDMSNASIQLAMAPYAAEKNKVVLIPGGTARLSGDLCQPEHMTQWMWDTYAQVGGISRGLTKPGTTWYLVTADYALGADFETNARARVGAAGGSVIGSVRHPFNAGDMSAYLIQAQASGADVIALANAGSDTITGIKQAREFGIGTDKQKLVAFFLGTSEVKGIGLTAAAGTVLTEGFYWDFDDGTRAFSNRFFARQNAMPSATQAGLYSQVRHYLKGVAASKSTDPATVMRALRTIPIVDDVVRNAKLRPDGRMVHDFYVFQVKAPAESTGPWDLYKVVAVIPGEEAFRPIADGRCPRLLEKGAS